MGIRRWTWLFVALALLLLPGIMTGCSEDSETQQNTGIYTIGPGNLKNFPTASGTINN